jgi:hypothetical protein
MNDRQSRDRPSSTAHVPAPAAPVPASTFVPAGALPPVDDGVVFLRNIGRRHLQDLARCRAPLCPPQRPGVSASSPGAPHTSSEVFVPS